MIIDGAMGTMVQSYELKEVDFRGEKFKDHKSDLKGNNEFYRLQDLMSYQRFIDRIWMPELISLRQIHLVQIQYHKKTTNLKILYMN